MSIDAPSKIDQFRKSPLGQRIGTGILAGITVVYLALITYSFSDRLQSTRNIVVFVLLVTLGIVALAVLSRPWRNVARRNQDQSQDSK